MNGFPHEAADTADFLLFFDKLFDSFNGYSFEPKHGKYLRVALKDNSPHIEFWNEAIKVLKSIKFIKKRSPSVPPSIKNWTLTIERTRGLWKNLKKEGHTYLKTKSLNQDPLENFFGQIRSLGVRYTNPNCFAFIGSYKTLIINNFFSVHSPGANCEKDPNVPLDNLNKLLLNNNEKEDCAVINVEQELLPVTFGNNNQVSHLGRNTVKYVAGFVVKKIFKFITCANCRKDIKSGSDEYNFLIDAKKYHKNALITPGAKINSYFCFFICNLNNYLEKNCTQTDIKKKMLLHLRKYDISIGCNSHRDRVNNIFFKFLSHYYLQIWIKNINKTLKGKDENINKEKYNKIRLLAYKRYLNQKRKQLKFKSLKKLQ